MSAGGSVVVPIRLRPVTLQDQEKVLAWRNDPFILARSTSQHVITAQEHVRWFEETVRGEVRRMFVVVAGGEEVGVVRFDRLPGSDCVISVYLVESHTGKGYGIAAIQLGWAKVFDAWNSRRVIACVRRDNEPAHRAFLKAGYVEDNSLKVCPDAHWTLVRERGGARS